MKFQMRLSLAVALSALAITADAEDHRAIAPYTAEQVLKALNGGGTSTSSELVMCDPFLDPGCNPVDPEDPPLGCPDCEPGNPYWEDVIELFRDQGADPRDAGEPATQEIPQFPEVINIDEQEIFLNTIE